MEDYKLPYCFKRAIVFDALYQTGVSKISLEEWFENYLYSQEVMFPRELEYVSKTRDFLDKNKLRINPQKNEDLVTLITKSI